MPRSSTIPAIALLLMLPIGVALAQGGRRWRWWRRSWLWCSRSGRSRAWWRSRRNRHVVRRRWKCCRWRGTSRSGRWRRASGSGWRRSAGQQHCAGPIGIGSCSNTSGAYVTRRQPSDHRRSHRWLYWSPACFASDSRAVVPTDRAGWCPRRCRRTTWVADRPSQTRRQWSVHQDRSGPAMQRSG